MLNIWLFEMIFIYYFWKIIPNFDFLNWLISILIEETFKNLILKLFLSFLIDLDNLTAINCQNGPMIWEKTIFFIVKKGQWGLSIIIFEFINNQIFFEKRISMHKNPVTPCRNSHFWWTIINVTVSIVLVSWIEVKHPLSVVL